MYRIISLARIYRDIDKKADSTSKINSLVGSLEHFEELKNRLVADASAKFYPQTRFCFVGSGPNGSLYS